MRRKLGKTGRTGTLLSWYITFVLDKPPSLKSPVLGPAQYSSALVVSMVMSYHTAINVPIFSQKLHFSISLHFQNFIFFYNRFPKRSTNKFYQIIINHPWVLQLYLPHSPGSCIFGFLFAALRLGNCSYPSARYRMLARPILLCIIYMYRTHLLARGARAFVQLQIMAEILSDAVSASY